jgi:hypothetical protein
MINKFIKLGIIIIILFGVVFTTIPINAISSYPTSNSIYSVNVFENCLELGDMAFSTDFIWSYPSTALPIETATQVLNIRLMQGATQIRSVAPYSFFNNGFNRGLVWMYFTADQVTSYSLTWSGVYTMRLDGNPTASWSGLVPTASALSSSSFSWRTSTTLGQTQLLFEPYLLIEADSIQKAWNNTNYILLSNTAQNGTKLTIIGDTYFSSIIPNIKTLAPNIFLSTQLIPEYREVPITPGATASVYALDIQGITYLSTTDTASFTTNSPTISGIGTAWTTNMENGQIKFNTDKIWYKISKVVNPTTITLTSDYKATGGTGAYTINYSNTTTNPLAPANPLSLSQASDLFSIPKTFVGIILSLIVIIFVMAHGTKAANSYKAALLIVVPLLFFFTRIGWMSIYVTVIMGLLTGLAFAYVFFIEKSNV